MFSVKIPLEINDYLFKKLKSRFEAARLFENAIRSEIVKRKRKYLESEELKIAKEFYKQHKSTKYNSKEEEKVANDKASNLYRIAKRNSGYYLKKTTQHERTDSILQFGTEIIAPRNCLDGSIGTHLDSATCNEISGRVFKAIESSSTAERNFKGYGRDFVTTIISRGVKLEDDTVIWSAGRKKNTRLVIPIGRDRESKLQRESQGDTKLKMLRREISELKKTPAGKKTLDNRIGRISRRLVKGKWQYYAIFRCDGVVPIKKGQIRGDGKIGVDPGPSKFTYVTEEGEHGDIELASDVDFKQPEIRRLSRKLDRQRRSNNKDNYNNDGTVKSGKLIWRKSKRQEQTEMKLRELKRKQADYRKNLHGQGANKLRSLGDDLRIEKNSYRSFQRNKSLSKSVTNKAPGMMAQLTIDKFNLTGGEAYDINPYKAKLSQYCPKCGSCKKKKLSERIHKCETCGYEAPRDKVSALLAIYTDPETGEKDFKKTKELADNVNF